MVAGRSGRFRSFMQATSGGREAVAACVSQAAPDGAAGTPEGRARGCRGLRPVGMAAGYVGIVRPGLEAKPAAPDAGMAGPDVGIAGPDVGMAGSDVGMAGPDVGMGEPDVGMAGPDVGAARPEDRPSTAAQGRPGQAIAKGERRAWRSRATLAAAAPKAGPRKD